MVQFPCILLCPGSMHACYGSKMIFLRFLYWSDNKNEKNQQDQSLAAISPSPRHWNNQIDLWAWDVYDAIVDEASIHLIIHLICLPYILVDHLEVRGGPGSVLYVLPVTQNRGGWGVAVPWAPPLDPPLTMNVWFLQRWWFMRFAIYSVCNTASSFLVLWMAATT